MVMINKSFFFLILCLTTLCVNAQQAGPFVRLSLPEALKIAGEGIKRRGKPGDLLVRIKLVTPRSISSEQKELYIKLAELEGKSSASGGFLSGIMGKKKGKK